jgi:hypothetical protein
MQWSWRKWYTRIYPMCLFLWCLFSHYQPYGGVCLRCCRDLSVWVLFLPLSCQQFAWWSWFWILIGRVLLLQVWELASSCDNFLGWVGDCSSSLESEGCLSDLGLGDVCLGVFFFGYSAYIRHLCYVFFFTDFYSYSAET